MRGLVHVFKYLDTMALKEEKSRGGNTFDGNTTLRRNANTSNKVTTRVVDNQKIRQQHADSGYSTSDGTDKRLWQDVAANGSTPDADVSKWSPTAAHNRTLTNENVSPSTPNSSHSNSFANDQLDSSIGSNNKQQQSHSNGANNNRFVSVVFLGLHLNMKNILFLVLDWTTQTIKKKKKKEQNTKLSRNLSNFFFLYDFIGLFLFSIVYK